MNVDENFLIIYLFIKLLFLFVILIFLFSKYCKLNAKLDKYEYHPPIKLLLANI